MDRPFAKMKMLGGDSDSKFLIAFKRKNVEHLFEIHLKITCECRDSNPHRVTLKLFVLPWVSSINRCNISLSTNEGLLRK